MKVSYILVLSLPLMNALFNNNTGTCQCVCQKQNLGDTGDNLSDIVKNSLQYLIETKFVLCIYICLHLDMFSCVIIWTYLLLLYMYRCILILTIKIYVGFHACIHKWCLQSGTKQQYTKCQSVSVDGRTCYNPSIKYGSTIGGIPNKHWQNVYKEWCQQLFPTSNIMKSSVTYHNYIYPNKPKNLIGVLYWCSHSDESVPHWCDFKDGFWRNQQLGPYFYHGLHIVVSLTCQI